MMKCVLRLLALVILAVNGAAALRCYACMPNHNIAGVSLPRAIADRAHSYPRCSQLNAKDPELRFEMTCPRGLDKSCVKIRDEHGNEMRSCFGSHKSSCSKQTKKGQVLCVCKGDFCNSALVIRPAPFVLFVPLVAALLRLH
ncbi:uncharacterized protein LOC119101699 isoform X1 [Pollicipes pollicipes]|uniref:uncharacterized protein LOC119101699 isoform X1 n=1 Tax=Pollicipes pollicipes TaxID=41117 RepID=UPI001884A15F|nr:uncharacterized protein LOC119101699 isoform X1 [Pollicipes pollicipes]